MEFLGYFFALVIGCVIGLVGGGGSILTVPVLVYLLGIEPVIATGYSLFIVGIASISSSVSYLKRHLVDFQIVLFFGIPSVLAVYYSRHKLVPSLPDIIIDSSSVQLDKNTFLMFLLAVLIIFCASTMIREVKEQSATNVNNKRRIGQFIFLILQGVVIGLLTGMVGTGGGFMIIPALIIFSGLTMKKAVGTALLISSMKSVIGFTGEMSANPTIDYLFLVKFTYLAIAGIFVGNYLSKILPDEKLKKGFGWMLLLIGFIILMEEIIG